MYTATVKTNKFGETNLLMVEDSGRIEVTHFHKFDMKMVPLIPNRFMLTRAQNKLFIEALKTREGRELLQKLKNEKTNIIINEFLDGEKRKIDSYHKSMSEPAQESREMSTATHRPRLTTFIEKVISEPLTGRNFVNETTLGLSKKQIWDALISNGIIKS